jgi:hypothetical protein
MHYYHQAKGEDVEKTRLAAQYCVALEVMVGPLERFSDSREVAEGK